MEKRANDVEIFELQSKDQGGVTLSFQEQIPFAPGCFLRMTVTDVLYHARSKYQDIAVFETDGLGRVLVIDGITMLTEFDEYSYHEMISHVPLLVHPNPKRILVIGGGDGGVVREVLKHPEVQTVHLCEIDKMVVSVCRQYFPSLASCLQDSRVRLFYQDGAKFIAERRGYYDVIIVDSTDPFGPGRILFQKPFYSDMQKALTPEGIAVTQCESIFLHREVIEGVFSFAGEIFPKVGYYFTHVPTYPSGAIGFFFGSLGPDPVKNLDERRARRLRKLKYYTPDVHRAAFALPRFAKSFVSKKS